LSEVWCVLFCVLSAWWRSVVEDLILLNNVVDIVSRIGSKLKSVVVVVFVSNRFERQIFCYCAARTAHYLRARGTSFFSEGAYLLTTTHHYEKGRPLLIQTRLQLKFPLKSIFGGERLAKTARTTRSLIME
jgi:hypothetical protein